MFVIILLDHAVKRAQREYGEGAAHGNRRKEQAEQKPGPELFVPGRGGGHVVHLRVSPMKRVSRSRAICSAVWDSSSSCIGWLGSSRTAGSAVTCTATSRDAPAGTEIVSVSTSRPGRPLTCKR